jgi:hypothetical protein
MVNVALNYLNDYHFSVIPVGKNKKPLIEWEQYQNRYPTEEEIKEWWTKWPEANIAIITGLISNLAVIDIDTDEGKEKIQEYLPDSLVTPTAQTPRGGQHVYFRCPNAKLRNNTGLIKGCDLRANGGYVVAPPSVNGSGKAYSWILDLKTSISSLPNKYLQYIINNISLYTHGDAKKDLHDLTPSYKVLQSGRRDEDLFHVANALVKTRTPDAEVLQYLEILAKNCNPPFPKKEVEDKIKSALNRAERRDRNLTEEIRQYINLTTGYITLADLYSTLQILTKEEKNNVSVIMHRLCKDSIIERFGNKNGQFRRINKDIEIINWLEADETANIDIQYPLELHKHALTLPKNIVVIAGAKDAGKTAFLLNTACMNMDKLKIHYFSSEMGEIEMKKRIVEFREVFGMDLKKIQNKVHWINKSGEFADVIYPEDINIIDFLEITKDFFEIGDMIKNLYHKLTTGVVILGIQKPSNRDMPIGGEKGLEKARIAIAIDNHVAKILVGKNWATESNPKGLMCKFKVIKGCKFLMTEPWDKPEYTEQRRF